MQGLKRLHVQFGILLIAALAITPVLATTVKTAKASTTKNSVHKTSTKRTAKHRGKKTAKKSWKSKGQHAITSERTRQIQEALIRSHYLQGDANGEWDARTQAAMRKYQADQGWQSKVLPDSRALIKLGLGPDHSGVLNPETAAVSPLQPNPVPGGGEKSAVNAIAPATSVIRESSDQ